MLTSLFIERFDPGFERYRDVSTATKRSTLLLELLERCVTCPPGEEKEIVPKARRELNVGGC